MDPADWQARFIATNVLALGYNAWVGFLHYGRGAVICTLNHAQNDDYPTYFLPRFRLAPFLRAWLATPATPLLSHHFFVTHILDVVDHYDPSTEVVFFLESGAQATFFYLKNLPVPPPQSYHHICRQGEEFHLTRCRLPQSD